MECAHCKSLRVAEITARCKDQSTFKLPSDGIDYEGYVSFFSSDGDTLMLKICFDCGMVQGDFPITVENVQEFFGREEEREPLERAEHNEEGIY